MRLSAFVSALVLACIVTSNVEIAAAGGDCNSNGVADAIDIAMATSTDCNTNGVPDECDLLNGGGTQTINLAPNLVIPDGVSGGGSGVPATSTMIVPTSGTISDLDVGVVIQHTFQGDLAIVLTHDSTGTQVTLLDQPGVPEVSTTGFPDNHLGNPTTLEKFIFDDEAANPYDAGQPGAPVESPVGHWQPSPGLLSAFDGEDRSGNWRLIVTDNFGIDTGTLRTWSLIFTNTMDCNGNSILDACENDCNTNGVADECEFQYDDCNTDGIADFCDAAYADCNGNGRMDLCDVSGGSAEDCNGDLVPDSCQNDCNGNGIPDPCDILGGSSQDCDGDLQPDECGNDCNTNGASDGCDIASGSSGDCNTNGVADECELVGIFTATSPQLAPILAVSPQTANFGNLPPPSGDVVLEFESDGDLQIDDGEFYDIILNGTMIGSVFVTGFQDCVVQNDSLLVPHATFVSLVTDGMAQINVVPTPTVDFCTDPYVQVTIRYAAGGDCDDNGIPDDCDIAADASRDCNTNGALDQCEPGFGDCNTNLMTDFCEASYLDCNTNNSDDICDVAGSTSNDCDDNGVPDACDPDCNTNGVADACDVVGASALDCDGNGTPDACEFVDCNTNGQLDSCDIGGGMAADCNTSGVPDICEIQASIMLVSPQLSDIQGVTPQTAVFTSPPTATSDVQFVFETNGDVAGTDEFYDVELNGTPIGSVFVSGFTDCVVQTDTIMITSAEYNMLLAGGNASVAVIPTATVNFCEPAYVQVTLSYAQTSDCNTDGIPDECAADDCNGNGTPDACEPDAQDCNTNGVLDSCDILGGAPDSDFDIVPDVCDVCIGLFNPDQLQWTRREVQANDSGEFGSVAFDAFGNVGVAYYNAGNGNLRYWLDANGDLVSDASERRTIESEGVVGQYTSLAFDPSGRAAIAYYHASMTDLNFWYDANGNSAFDSGEVAVIESTSDVGQYNSLVFTADGKAVVAYHRASTGQLKIWYDADGNHAYTVGERFVIDGGNLGQYASLALNPAGRAVVAYYSAGATQLKLWVDLNGDFMETAGEIRVIDDPGVVGLYASLAFDASGRATVAYYDETNADLKLWHDADGDYEADAGEIRTILAPGDVGRYASLAFDAQGKAAVAYYRVAVKNLNVWRDIDGDFEFDADENLLAADEGDVGEHAFMRFHPQYAVPMIAFYDNTNGALGFVANLDWDGDDVCFVEDNCPTTFNPLQLPDDCESAGCATCPGDINGDGKTDGDDLQCFVSCLLSGGSGSCADCGCADLNGDTIVGTADVTAMVARLMMADVNCP